MRNGDPRLVSFDDLAELYPDGRTLYYEGGDPIQFIDLVGQMGLQITITVEVPADKLAEFYALSEATPFGIGS